MNTPDSTLRGMVFDISRACVHDGPGLRTVVYLKGCRLDCPWCHNPEGKSFEQEFSFDRQQCIAANISRNACTVECPLRDTAGGSGMENISVRVADACPPKAIKTVGRDYTAGELAGEVTEDEAFFRQTRGGVTFSGGEPMAQHEFLLSCAALLGQRHIHRVLETSGFWSGSLVKDVAQNLDMVLFDLKHVDSDKYKTYTGADNRQVLQNLEHLLRSDIDVELVLTLIPGFNDSEWDITSIADYLRTLSRGPRVRLLPFHRLAVSKERLFGRAYPYAGNPALPANLLSDTARLFQDCGIDVRV